MAQRVVGDVAVRVGADVGPLKIGLQDGARAVGRFSDTSSRRMQALAKNLTRVALAGGVMAGALTAASRTAIRELDAIGKTADRIGLTTDALQELRFAADQTGVPVQTLDMAMQRFTRRVAEARQGSGEAKAALEEMGIALFNANGSARDINSVLADVAEAMKYTAEGSDRVRLAMRLFDSEGVALVNTLSGGAGALQDMRDRARELGIVIEEDVIRSSEELNSELDALGQQIKADLQTALVAIGPALVGMAEGLATIADAAATALQEVSGFVAGLLAGLKSSEAEIAALQERAAARTDRRAMSGTNRNGGGGDSASLGDMIGNLLPDGGPASDPRGDRNAQLAEERAAAAAEAMRAEQAAVSDARLIGIAEAAEAAREAEMNELAATSDARLIAIAEAETARQEAIAEAAAKVEEAESASGSRRIEETRRVEEAITSIMSAEQRNRLSAIGSAFGDLASLMQTGNTKLFKIGQGAAIAEAVVSGYKAAVDAWEKGMSIGGPPVAAAFTAASLVKTGALISSIKAQQPSGGGGSQTNPGGGAVADSGGDAGQGSTVSREITVNLRGGLAGQSEGVRDILNQINQELDDGANLNVNLV